MKYLLNSNAMNVRNAQLMRLFRLDANHSNSGLNALLIESSGKQLFTVQKRYSRASKDKYRRITRLKRDFVFQKTGQTMPVKIKDLALNEDKPKTSITVELIGKQTLEDVTEWRKMELIKKARRVLPLPVSLTGLGDGQMSTYWRHRMRKCLHTFGRHERMENMNIYERLTPSLRIFIEAYPEKLSQQNPDLYEAYVKSKQEFLNRENGSNNEENKLITKSVQFPYEITKIIKQNDSMSSSKPNNSVTEAPRFNSGLIDAEYKDYLKQHKVMQYFAQSLKGIKNDEYEGEIEGWSEAIWRRNYGTPDPTIECSNVACNGCGAFLHCADTNIPGYMPSEKFKSLNELELQRERCQRCEYINHFNVAINVNVSPDEYPNLIYQIQNKKGIVIILIDLLDFPCSIWPGIIKLIGEKSNVYFVGNKVDLLPKDDEKYLNRVLDSLRASLYRMGIKRETLYRNVYLLSAKTGWGVENLITKLMKDRKKGEDIYLIGCTNVGKSTLFNALLQSDLCKLRDRDLISRATTSLWPGTTLNLIKFPINDPEGWDLQLRINRLKYNEREDVAERRLKRSLYRQTKNVQYAYLTGRIGMTYRSEVPFTVQSGHPFAKKTYAPKPFDPEDRYFKNCDFFCDTPGAIYKDQLLNLLTNEELLKTIPREIITPRTFSLKPLQSLFIGGLARLDLLHARHQVWFTVFASHYLPIHVVYTEQAKHFYYTYLGTDMLGVPMGGEERIKNWPLFLPKEFKLKGVNWTQSCADVVLSTAGWVAVTMGPDTHCVLKAFTPEGRGIYIRDPPLLSYAFKLRGKRILGTPCFENKLFTIDDVLPNDRLPKRHFLHQEVNIRKERFDKIRQ